LVGVVAKVVVGAAFDGAGDERVFPGMVATRPRICGRVVIVCVNRR
jgi:hypothetical protein